MDVSFPFFKKIGFWGIVGTPYCGIGATIRMGPELLCLPCAGFFGYVLLHRLIFLVLGHNELFFKWWKVVFVYVLCFFLVCLFVCLFDGVLFVCFLLLISLGSHFLRNFSKFPPMSFVQWKVV